MTGLLTRVLSQASTFDTPLVTRQPSLRTAERIIVSFFLYTAVWASVRATTPGRRFIAWLIPALICVLAATESRFSRPWSRVLRDWLTLGLILVAYRQLDWFSNPARVDWQESWIQWDRLVLDGWGLRQGIESLGAAIPAGLELIYLLLYAIPPICLGVLYIRRGRHRIEVFLTTLFLGTLCAYTLLPHFPTVSPRVAFANQDVPNYASIWRSINVWLLDHCDISTSVFPSGHVAVAFSAALGIQRAIPEWRRVWVSFLFAATLVFVATVYCRYHYSVDGLASIAIALIAWRTSEVFDPNA